MERSSWDEHFMEIAKVVSKRSTCLRRQVGAAFVLDKRIIATGYNGAPRGLKHCKETGCLREQMNVPSGEWHELRRGVHAEANCIVQAALHGVSVRGATMYITHTPCSFCLRMLLNLGLVEIVCEESYPDPLAAVLLKDSDLQLRFLPRP